MRLEFEIENNSSVYGFSLSIKEEIQQLILQVVKILQLKLEDCPSYMSMIHAV